jgi:hypothetical protein
MGDNNIDGDGGEVDEDGSDVWRVVDDYYGQAVGKLQAEKYDEHSSKSFPSVRNQGLVGQEKSRQYD